MKLRPRFIGLPIQRSTFDRLAEAGSLVGLAEALPDGFRAELDASGSLHVDDRDVDAVRAAFPHHPGREFVTALETKRRSVCADLLSATRAAASIARAGDPPDLRRTAIELLARLADFMPYPLLTKVVPQLLAGALDASGHPPVEAPPGPSPGLRLTLSLERLATWCSGEGWSGERIAAAWPDVPPHIAAALIGFCATHSGFGPVAWDAPGFESPAFVVRAMIGATPSGALPASRHPPVFADLSPNPDAHPMTVVGALTGWLDMTDHQIWYVRTAFYRGLLPLLGALADDLSMPVRHTLFITRHELADGLPDTATIEGREAAYWADTGYLEANAVPADRLETMLGGFP